MYSPAYAGFRYKYVLTLILVITNIIFFIAIDLNPNRYYENLLIQNNSAILNNGEWWRLFSAMWLHANPLHIADNMIGLLIFGITLESFAKKWQYLVIYLVSGLLGNVASLFLLGPGISSLGASGAIFGVLAAAYIICPFNKRGLAVAFFFVVYYILASMAPGVDTWAHLFGAVGGIIFGFIFTPKNQGTRRRFARGSKYGNTAPFYARCPRCGKVVEIHAKYCPSCDLPLEGMLDFD